MISSTGSMIWLLDDILFLTVGLSASIGDFGEDMPGSYELDD